MTKEVAAKSARARVVSVTLCVGSGSYQAGLVKAVLANGMLARAMRVSPFVEVFDVHGTSLTLIKSYSYSPYVNRVIWGVWRRLPGTRLSSFPVAATAWLTDRYISRWIPASTIFHGLNGNSLHSLRVARKQGSITLLESAMMHPRRWQIELLQECRTFGIHPRDCITLFPSSLIKRFEKEYALSHSIVVPSKGACQSFEDEGVSNSVVVLPGVDETIFRPIAESSQSQQFRACYVGRVELAKGIPYLLEAWKRLGLRKAELILAGEVRSDIKSLLARYAGLNIKLTGLLPQKDIAELLRNCSLFVFPSLHEGFALAILEAMASSLPVIVSKNSGADDCVLEGENGFVVPTRSVDELAERILWAYEHQDELPVMGRKARTKIESNFTLRHFESRMVDLYRSLA